MAWGPHEAHISLHIPLKTFIDEIKSQWSYTGVTKTPGMYDIRFLQIILSLQILTLIHFLQN